MATATQPLAKEIIMRQMFKQFFSGITAFFSAFERGANTLDNYAKWAESESAAFEEEASVERTARMNQLRENLQLVHITKAA
jgi:hypothetical protein